MTERGVPVDHSTIYRWVQKYAQKLNDGCAGSGIRFVLPAGGSMKHTSRYGASSGRRLACRPGNEWAYLYRAVD